MKNHGYILFFTFAVLLGSCSEQSSDVPKEEWDTSDSEQASHISLTHIDTYKMVVGTHRPEILVVDDHLYLLVVHPNMDEGIQHRGYIFDASDPTNIDFDSSEDFALTPEGSDHRAVIMDDEIVVVYQVNVMSEDMPDEPISGPAEDYAISQQLMMARFSLNGEESFRDEILTTTNFEEDNFPDMCMLPWGDESFLVSTGNKTEGPATEEVNFKIREVNLNGEILLEEKYTTNTDTASSIGNSMFAVSDGFLFFSSTDSLSITKFSEGLDMGDTLIIEQDNDLAYTFPTGVIEYGNFYVIGYSSRLAGDPDIVSNPLYPAIMVVNKDFELLIDGQINELFSLDTDPGSGHVHPTLAIIDNQLFYSWSGKAETEGGGAAQPPQVRIEVLEIQSD